MTALAVRLSGVILAAAFVWRALLGAPPTPFSFVAAILVGIVLMGLVDRWTGFIIERLRL